MSKVPIFLFLILVEKKIDLVLNFTKVNAPLVIYKPVTYIGEVISEFLFYSLQILIDLNLQLVAYHIYTTETAKVQEWILVELRIVERQR